MHEHEVALPLETLAAFDNDAFRARIFHEKYALRDAEGTVREHTPAELWQRVAQGIAAVEEPAQHKAWEAQFFWLLSNFRMVPGGRILHAIGHPYTVTALNCYVVPAPHDSIHGIYHTAWELAETFKRGGGCGVDLSSLRPRHTPTHNAARSSSGAVSFMELYSVTTGTIGQDGRRGALMLTMADSHPDVLDFCRSKRNLEKVRYANISVRLTDAFMQAVEQDAEWRLHYDNPADRIAIQRSRARQGTVGGTDHRRQGFCRAWRACSGIPFSAFRRRIAILAWAWLAPIPAAKSLWNRTGIAAWAV